MQARDDLVATAAYQPEPAAASAARRFVRDTLRTWQVAGRPTGRDELVDDAVLLTSELVTNAVVHAGTPVQVTCRLAAGAVEVVVLDRHPVQLIPDPQNGEITEAERTSGRGLMLPAELASSWGVTYARTAKAVWFRLGIAGVDAADEATGQVGRGQHTSQDGGQETSQARGQEPGRAAGQETGQAGGQEISRAGGHEPGRAAGQETGRAGGQEISRAAGQEPGRAAGQETGRAAGQEPGRAAGQGTGRAPEHGPDRAGGLGRRPVPSGMLTAIGTVGGGLPAGGPGRPARDLPPAGEKPVPGLPVWARRNLGRLGYEELLSHTVEAARAMTAADAAYLLAVGDDGELKVRAAAGAGPASGAGVAQLAAGSATVAAGPARALADAALSLVTVPLLAEGRVTGVLAVAAAEPGRFRERDAARLQDLADRSAATLERARLGELERARLARVSYLAEAGEMLASHLDREKIVALAAQLVVPQLADWCAVLLPDADGVPRAVYLCHADENRADALAWLLEHAPPAVMPETPATAQVQAQGCGRLAGKRWQLAVQAGPAQAVGDTAAAPAGADRPGPAAVPDGADQPGDGADQPDDGASRPGSGAGRPGNGAGWPGDGADQPGDGADQPGDGAGRPGSALAPGRPVTPGTADWPGGAVPPGVAQLAADGAWCFPLIATDGRIGLLAIGGVAGGRLSAEVTELAEGMARRTALALDNARQRGRQQFASRRPRPVLRPADLPKIPGIDLAVAHDGPAGAGGDFCDIFPVGADRWRFVIADVCGTGPEAAAISGLARYTLRILAREGHSIAAVLDRLNDLILDEGKEARFLTLVHGEVAATVPQAAAVRVSLACAGHPQPLVLRYAGGMPDPAADAQPLLGVIDGLTFSAQTVDLAAGDLLLAVTDGVTNRRHGPRLLDDGDGLARILAGCRGLGAGAVAARIQQAARDFSTAPASDDMALLALRAS